MTQRTPLSAVPATTDRQAAVVLEDVAQRLGTTWALRGVSLEIPRGELVAVVGHNGSGKTTLLRVVSTALRATRGRGTVFGFDLVRQADDVRGICSMLTHGASLYADLTARENLMFSQRMAGEPANLAAIDLALHRVGLIRSADVRVKTFSSGMQRRASIARLFLRPTPLLLLDEPYNSLDPRGGRLVDELLVDVRERGGAAMIVLHDLDRAGVDFDRGIELERGRVARIELCRAPLVRERAMVGV